MLCKSDGINYYCYQHDGELCKGKVMGWGWAFQWDPPCVTPTWSGWNLDSFGFEFCSKIWVSLLWLWQGLNEGKEPERRD